jgi:hypothetical protein
MKPESLSPYPQVLATCPYPEPTASSPHDPPTFWRSILILSSHLLENRILTKNVEQEPPWKVSIHLFRKFPAFFGKQRSLLLYFPAVYNFESEKVLLVLMQLSYAFIFCNIGPLF